MVNDEIPTGMKALRLALGRALSEGLDGVMRTRIVVFPANIDNVEAGRIILMLDRTSVEKLPTNPIGDFRNNVTLNVVGYRSNGAEAEDVLDDALDAVILVLDDIEWLIWRQASRAVFGDQQAPCYQITLEAVSSKEG